MRCVDVSDIRFRQHTLNINHFREFKNLKTRNLEDPLTSVLSLVPFWLDRWHCCCIRWIVLNFMPRQGSLIRVNTCSTIATNRLLPSLSEPLGNLWTDAGRNPQAVSIDYDPQTGGPLALARPWTTRCPCSSDPCHATATESRISRGAALLTQCSYGTYVRIYVRRRRTRRRARPD
jgi:hypothetical protein